MDKQTDQIKGLRRKDFWTALVLIGLSLAMLMEVSGYPITDSYGGVQNVWYVSPALFPLLVSLALLLLSLVLLTKSIISGGAREALRRLGSANKSNLSVEASQAESRTRVRFWTILTVLVCYVYGLVPAMDFIVASVLFLNVFIGNFYLEIDRPLNLPILILVAMAVVGLAQTLGWLPDQGDLFDWLGLVMILVIAGYFFSRSGERFKVARVFTVSLITVLLVAPLFRFVLLVPLPHEGLVIGWMDSVRYLLRSIIG
ncbi:MAG: hypothetical protein DHS20C01_20040 [marine bacterium B5-7]|nr:MAG: hypothetical protein DHS20C01_20040 [marine bacterium B5-7]